MDSLFNKKLNMLSMYEDAIERGQNKTFATYQRISGVSETYSFNYIKQQSDLLLKKMNDCGLKKGDRVGVIASLRPWWFALTYACLRGNYVMVCIDPGVPAMQVQKMLIDTEVRAIFTTLKTIHLPKEINNYIPVFSIEENFPLISKCNNVSIFLDEAKKLPDDTFFILFSSGTTGENRKAVLLKHETVTLGIEYGMSKDAGIYKNTSAYTIRECDLMLFPPYHIAGLLCATYDFYCNTDIIMLERLTPNALMSVLQNHKPDNICTVPSMLSSMHKKILANYSNKLITKTIVNALLNVSSIVRKTFGIKIGRVLLKPINKRAFGGNMKGFMIGASPFDYESNKYYLDMGIDVAMAYGLTELGAPLATTGQGYYPGTAGRVLKHTDKLDIRISNKDETGRGEVEILSPYRMISYLNEKDNEGCFTEDGYFKTGDLGYFDSNNCLIICGRIKESIVLRNGEKLLPEEIESKYQNMDCVAEVCAFKVPGDNGCDNFSIAIITNKDSGIPDDAMKVRVYNRADALPQMYRPKDVYVLKEFPLSSSHKVQRFRLTQMALNGENEPITDASMIPIDEDSITSSLRQMLIKVGGSQWEKEELTQGLLLNLDSLSTIDLYVEIENKWNIDLFQSSSQPETFGELLDIVKNYDEIDKKNKSQIDLSKYPLRPTAISKFTAKQLERLIKTVYRVKGYGLENLPSDNNYILCSIHKTEIDPGFICNCLPKKVVKNTCIVGKAEIVDNLLLKQLVVSRNFIPIERLGNSINTLNRCQELLNEGKNILIFPEGTNVMNHEKVFQLKEGPARLSIATGKPIIPVNITGIAQNNREISNFSLPPLKGKIKVMFGKPIYPSNLTPAEINKILTEKIEELAK